MFGFDEPFEIDQRQCGMCRGVDGLGGCVRLLETIVRDVERGLRVGSPTSNEQQPSELQCGLAAAQPIVAPIERRQSASQLPLGCRMPSSQDEPFSIAQHVDRARVHDERPGTVSGSPFRRGFGPPTLRRYPAAHCTNLAWLVRDQPQQRKRQGGPVVSALEDRDRTAGYQRSQLGEHFEVLQHRQVNRQEAAQSQIARVWKFFDRQHAR